MPAPTGPATAHCPGEPPARSAARRRDRARGFTLIELMVVIAIMGMLFRLVTMNLGAMIPARAMDSEAAQLVSRIDFLRSEARLQGKTFILELDLDQHRFRTLIPVEDQLAASDLVVEPMDTGWSPLSDNVQFGGCAVAGGTVFNNGLYGLQIDKDGHTADQAIYLKHAVDDNLLWTIQLHGLTGTCRTLTSVEGMPHPLELMDEGRF